MTQENNQNFDAGGQHSEEAKVTFQRIIGKTIINWPLFAICTIVALFLAFLYLRYSTSQYKIDAKVLVKDDKKDAAGGMLDEDQLLQDIGLSGSKNNVDNEVEIFKSRTLMEDVVRDLQLNIRYFSSGRIKNIELYHSAPFRFVFTPWPSDSAFDQTHNYRVKVLDKDKFTIDEILKKGHKSIAEG